MKDLSTSSNTEHYSFRHLQRHVFNTNIFLFKQCRDRPTKTSAHLPVPLMWRARGEDGAPVNLFLNGTFGSCSVQWHLKVQSWPFNCALITFMSWGRQQPQNNPSSFMNTPLGHCPSRPSPGILAAPSDPLPPIPQYVNGAGPVQQCHGSFC